MNNYREMYEALLRGETLLSTLGEEMSMTKYGVIQDKVCNMVTGITVLSPHQWSIKPKTININGFEVPEPVREPLNYDESYWLVYLDEDDGVMDVTWSDSKADRFCLSKGLIHTEKEAAVLHAKALWSFTAKEGV